MLFVKCFEVKIACQSGKFGGGGGGGDVLSPFSNQGRTWLGARGLSHLGKGSQSIPLTLTFWSYKREEKQAMKRP